MKRLSIPCASRAAVWKKPLLSPILKHVTGSAVGAAMMPDVRTREDKVAPSLPWSRLGSKAHAEVDSWLGAPERAPGGERRDPATWPQAEP
jgi:hypothetical protein